MVHKIEIRTVNSLLESEMELMNTWMKKEFGEKYIRDFKKLYPGESKCFFVKDEDDIIAFGIMNPVVAEHLGKKHDFFGVGDIVTIRRGEGYGRIIMEAMIEHLKNNDKPGLGFCARKNTPFYKKIGMGTKEDFMKRFRYRDPKTGEPAPIENGDGIFYDNHGFIKSIINTDSPVYLDTKLW